MPKLEPLKPSKISQSDASPDSKQTIDPKVFQAVTLDNISVEMKKLLDVTLTNRKLLYNILKELKDEADEGEFIILRGTATTTAFNVIETSVEPGHPVKGYEVSNSGPNTIYVGHNISQQGVLPDLVDVTSSVSRFQQILSKENIKFVYNRNKINNLAILASGGNSTFRVWLTW